MHEDWKQMSKSIASRWAHTMEGELNSAVENVTTEWSEKMARNWGVIAKNASHRWTDVMHKEWRAALGNATNWASHMEGRWDQSLDNRSGWTHTMDSYWNKLERSEEFRETMAREHAWQQRLKQGLRHRLGGIANETNDINREMLRQQMKHTLKAGMQTVGNLSAQADLWRGDIDSLLHPGKSANGSAAPRCPDLDGLYIEKVLHSNLGGQGPQPGEQSLIFASNRTEGGVTVKRLAFRVTALSPYSPGWAQMNGLSHGLVGKYGQVTLKPATNVTLRIQTFDLDTKEPIHMPSAAFTFFDLDEYKGHQASEYVTVRNFESFELTPSTEVRMSKNADGSTTFQASTEGTYDDNPVDPLLLTEQQKNRAVTVRFGNVSEIEVILGATPVPTNPGTWRCFTFVAHPVLKCAKTLGVETTAGPSPVMLLGAGIVCLALALCATCMCCCL
uniref:Uncharacterized protein n=1 Tax=Alexandrium catenella TaxID=2925 RepID=A0A7S1R466_ALECA